MAAASSDEVSTPLLAEEGGVRQRVKRSDGGPGKRKNLPDDWNEDCPYGGKVYLARQKKPDPWWVTTLEIITIIGVVAFCYYAYYYFDNMHFHVAHGYAHLGYSTAQHHVAQRYLYGKGIDQDEGVAMEWFKKASDQGHPHAAYNLAIGHIKGIRKDILEPGEAHKLINHAATNGVKEAHRVLNGLCRRGGCN
ncbi:hypothetical protein CAPTEDRAFT_227108 [Capitella teleta]|uniref:Uncharacterized protein n=1 Tax=Capitella teleta TaxID=283909 RepID=R7TUH8_CAPTE|nr:hypothetical protein CAPTEDRAFT_227108 [Capitella teleta]|eukprot:ELT97237.1 hypothetical protein CAPTEDRAFT_227108 [Capitella teleta]